MKRIILTLLSILLGAVIMLAPIAVLLWTVLEVQKLAHPVLRPLAIAGLTVLGIVLFVGSTYISTHLVVRFFRPDKNRELSGPSPSLPPT